jgi:hypothetical protein
LKAYSCKAGSRSGPRSCSDLAPDSIEDHRSCSDLAPDSIEYPRSCSDLAPDSIEDRNLEAGGPPGSTFQGMFWFQEPIRGSEPGDRWAYWLKVPRGGGYRARSIVDRGCSDPG